MGIKYSVIVLKHDDGYGDDLIYHVRSGLHGKDMVALSATEINAPCADIDFQELAWSPKWCKITFDDWEEAFRKGLTQIWAGHHTGGQMITLYSCKDNCIYRSEFMNNHQCFYRMKNPLDS